MEEDLTNLLSNYLQADNNKKQKISIQVPVKVEKDDTLNYPSVSTTPISESKLLLSKSKKERLLQYFNIKEKYHMFDVINDNKIQPEDNIFHATIQQQQKEVKIVTYPYKFNSDVESINFKNRTEKIYRTILLFNYEISLVKPSIYSIESFPSSNDWKESKTIIVQRNQVKVDNNLENKYEELLPTTNPYYISPEREKTLVVSKIEPVLKDPLTLSFTNFYKVYNVYVCNLLRCIFA